MHEIQNMLASYDLDPKALSAPDIPAELVAWLRTVVSAERVEGHQADPLFAYGRSTTLRCKSSDGTRRTVQLWGNTDGWGAVELKGGGT
jgi:hypothetical protein